MFIQRGMTGHLMGIQRCVLQLIFTFQFAGVNLTLKRFTYPFLMLQVYVPKKSRLLCSGPLVPPGGSMEDMLREHERQIQEAVRKARLEKGRTKKNCYDYD